MRYWILLFLILFITGCKGINITFEKEMAHGETYQATVYDCMKHIECGKLYRAYPQTHQYCCLIDDDIEIRVVKYG